MAPRSTQTVEAQEVAAAPVVKHVTVGKPLSPAQVARAVEVGKRAALSAQVTELFTAQFGGEDQEPTEGTEKWDPMVRELCVEADKLEATYRATLAAKENNRTLLRGLAGMGKVPAVVPDFYYPPKTRKGSSEG